MSSLRPLTALSLALPLSILSALTAGADDLLPADRTIEQAIDHYIDARLTRSEQSAAPQADDAVLLRRLALDLGGRIPTAHEAREYVAAKDPNKRAALVDRLLDSQAFVQHQANEFDTALMFGANGSLREYLEVAMAENRPWDQVFREIISGDESVPGAKGIQQYLKARLSDTDKLTNDVSIHFFGINVSCAKCHDHPLVPDWTQEHFFGMKSFFDRSFDNGGFLAEREYGLVDYKTVEGEGRTANLMFLSGKVLEEPDYKEPSDAEKKKLNSKFDEFKKKKQAPPAPSYSRRARLLDVALQPGERDFFARAIVNRLWARFYGQGLVTPIDQMHSENLPSHPDLLSWLARDLIEHQYDLRRLTRGLVMSQAYSRTSRWESGERPAPHLFAVAPVRPLTPAQYGTALKMAAADLGAFRSELTSEELEKQLIGFQKSGLGMARNFEQPQGEFQISVDEALLFSNNERMVQDLVGSGIAPALAQLESDEELIDTAYWQIYGRAPDKEEVAAVGAYLKDRADRREQACRQLVWALLAGSEFRFNY